MTYRVSIMQRSSNPTTLLQPIKAGLKLVIATLLYRTGLLWLWSRFGFRGKAVVLMYHRILPTGEAQESFSHPGIIVSPTSFAHHLSILNRFFTPLTLQEFEYYLESREPFPRGACLVTFDDGWLDNHTHALPLLAAHKTPAVVFTASDYIGSINSFWQEQLGHLLHEASMHSVGHDVLTNRGIELGEVHEKVHLRARIASTVDRYRQQPYAEIQSLIADIEEALRKAGLEAIIKPRDRFMNWDQISALAEQGITVGSHTCSHRILTRLDPQDVDQELSESRSVIEDRLGCKVSSLAYPNGDFNASVRTRVQAQGYRMAFTTQAGVVVPSTDALTIPRINIHEGSANTTALFLCRILRIF